MRLDPITVTLLSVGVLCIAGCQQGDSLSGAVTYNGEPVETGSVAFASADGSGPGFGVPVVNGKYTTDKVRLGEHIAHVRGRSKPPPMTREELEQQRYAELPVEYIPEDAEGNAQTVEIVGGEQTLDFDIKGPPRPK